MFGSDPHNKYDRKDMFQICNEFSIVAYDWMTMKNVPIDH